MIIKVLYKFLLDSPEGKIEKFSNINTRTIKYVPDAKNDIEIDVSDRRVKVYFIILNQTIYHYDKKMDLLIDEKSSLNKDAEPKDEYSELCYNSDDDNELGNYETNDNTNNDSNEKFLSI